MAVVWRGRGMSVFRCDGGAPCRRFSPTARPRVQRREELQFELNALFWFESLFNMWTIQ